MCTILVVDDDQAFLAQIDKVLTSAGYRVLQSFDSSAALQLIEKKHREIDLAIIDLSLPNTSGFELIGILSRRPSALKLIAATCVFKDRYLELATSLGAHASLRKPQQGENLPSEIWLDTIRRVIGKPPDPNHAATAAN